MNEKVVKSMIAGMLRPTPQVDPRTPEEKEAERKAAYAELIYKTYGFRVNP